MKKFILLAFLPSFCFAVPKTYKARTDSVIVQPLIPPPDMGNAIGAGKIFKDARYNNARTLRVTDAKAGLARGGSFQVADSGNPTLWSSDSKLFIVTNTGDTKFLYTFNPSKFTVAQTPLSFNGSVGFSRTRSRQLFKLFNSQLHSIILSTDGQSIISDTLIYDFVNGTSGSWGTTQSCLPAGYHVTWSGVFVPRRDNKTFVIAFSSEGVQGTGHEIAAFSQGKGCRVYDTATGQITGQWGKVGPVDDGVAPLADRFYLHEGGVTQSGLYAHIEPTLRKPNGSSGCVAGNCNLDGPYFWQVATTHVRLCGPYHCDGHAAKGNLYTLTGSKVIVHSFADPSKPLTILVANPFCYDHHTSWNNSGVSDTNPVFYNQTRVNSTPVTLYDCPYENEILGIPVDGSSVVYRFGQSENTGSSTYFAIQNAVGDVDASGRFMLFASDWMNTLGYEADEKTNRGDVFILELK